MLIGYVSDERFLAIGDVLVEFLQGECSVAVVRSTPRGAIYAELTPGRYRACLCRPGYGAKGVEMTVEEGKPYQFRLLSDCLLGYVWPKWVQSGGRSEFRVHAVEPYHLSVWRYGLKKEFERNIGWFDEHGPRATMQVTPDGDYVQTGVEWNKRGYDNPHHTQFVTGPERSGLYYLHAKGESGAFFSFPWIVAPAKPQAKIAVVLATTNWNAYNHFGGRSNYIHPEGLPAAPPMNSRLDLERYQKSGFSGFRAGGGEPCAGGDRGDGPDCGAAGEPSGAGGVAVVGLAGAGGVCLRCVLGVAAALWAVEPGRLFGADDEQPSGVCDDSDVRQD